MDNDDDVVASQAADTRSSTGFIPLEILSRHDSLTWAPATTSEKARHRTEFVTIRTLGRGAFGTTFLVKNIVDSQYYALKVVRAGNGAVFGAEECRKVLREVDMLSGESLSNHVVRYYAAWVERCAFPSAPDGVSSTEGAEGFSFPSNSLSPDATEKEMSQMDPVCNLCKSSYRDWEVSFEHWGLLDAVLQPMNLCVECYKESVPLHVDFAAIAIREQRVLPECLFILMELCEYTLNEAVRACGNNEERIWSLFVQCVQGLAHLHSSGIVHRDVKPSNIFVREGVVKFGDFGLAIRREMDYITTGNSSDGTNSTGVGTYLYAAPEVSTGNYSEKCDVFSLGIILVEMFSDFHTGMERVEVLGNLRSEGVLPKDWEAANHFQASLARRMVSKDSKSRPSCMEILGEMLREGILAQPDTGTLADLVTCLQSRVMELEARLKEKDEENAGLRRLLGENEVPLTQN